MRITVSNELLVNEPSKELIQWCKRNLEISNPDYAKKARMGFWLGNTPKTLCLYKWHGTDLILPFGLLQTLPKEIVNTSLFVSAFKPPIMVDFNASVPLYDYQEIAVKHVIKARYGILQSAAGSGKTQMGIALACQLGRRTLWLCHTLDLIKQSRDRAKQYIDESLLGTITEGKVNLGPAITFATIQTMSKLDLSEYVNYWDVIITDEVHRVSGSPTSVTQYQHVLNSLAARHKYGLSATVHRSDGMIQATFSLVGPVVYTVPDEAIADKIMKVGIYPIGTGIKLSIETLNTDGTLNYSKLINYLCNNIDRNKLIIKELENNKDESVLILSDRLSHLETLMNMLSDEMKQNAVMISGKMTSKKDKHKRELAIEDMRQGNKKYLFATYSLAKEGLDIPRLERLFMVTPQKDYAVITQSIGRIARVFDGKDNPIAYDFVDDMPYTAKAYKKRLSTYKKLGCKIC